MSKGILLEAIEALEEAEIYIRGFKCEAAIPRTHEQASRLLKIIDNIKTQYRTETQKGINQVLEQALFPNSNKFEKK